MAGVSPSELRVTAAMGTRVAVRDMTSGWPRFGRWPKIQQEPGARGDTENGSLNSR